MVVHKKDATQCHDLILSVAVPPFPSSDSHFIFLFNLILISCHCCERNFHYLNWLSTRICGAGRPQVGLCPARLVEKVINIDQNSRSQTALESVCSVSKLSESVGRRRELVANSVHAADVDATQLDSWVASASAVCIWLYHFKIRETNVQQRQCGTICWELQWRLTRKIPIVVDWWAYEPV